MAHFSLDFEPDGDDEASLFASFDTGDFKARCHYWCPPREFEDLSIALRAFPIRKDAPLDMQWCWNCISLRIEPIDSFGHLAVRVSLREFDGNWNSCQSQFLTSYGEIDRFREQLDKAIDAGHGKAELRAQ
ncbi:hypothetical protein P1X14_04875 [Sphingomonas sp. AOB5]|uniref:hypothetical protein n=1 Tax=Sphingomonas sp. AOB5 TaxID=3034017 RepID=UPI0023F86F78|nr:hypothetical protein [Sphingomonas sp. AOB5]MDF7774571.1 hypothetical protein [Sphingomonas sp. AOB5]